MVGIVYLADRHGGSGSLTLFDARILSSLNRNTNKFKSFSNPDQKNYMFALM